MRRQQTVIWIGMAASLFIGSAILMANAATAGYLPKYDANGTLIDSALFETGGKVGLGTASPLAKLHLSGDGESALSAKLVLAEVTSGKGQFFFHSTRVSSANRLAIGEGADEFLSITGDGQDGALAQRGNVGIGTSTPAAKLHLSGDGESTTSAKLILAEIASGKGLFYLNSTRVSSANRLAIGEGTDEFLSITADGDNGALTHRGNVGVGTTTPGAKLDVAGSLRGRQGFSLHDGTASGGGLYMHKTATGSGANTGATLSSDTKVYFLTGGTPAVKAQLDESGNFTVAGNLAAKYQDVAEWVDVEGTPRAGTVVVAAERAGIVSSRAYDTSVIGIVSAQPGVLLGEAAPGRVAVAQSGRVRVKVDASKHPIRVGDLLVTSSVAGHAMRSVPVELGGVSIHRPGTIIGKALEPLKSGRGEILILVTLQ